MNHQDIIAIHEAAHAVAAWKLSRRGGAVQCGDGRKPCLVYDDGGEAYGLATIPAQVGGWRESSVAIFAGAIGTAIVAGVETPFRSYDAARLQALDYRLTKHIRRKEKKTTPIPTPSPARDIPDPTPLPDIEPEMMAGFIEHGGGGDINIVVLSLDDYETDSKHRSTFYELRQRAIDLCSVNAAMIRALADHLGHHPELDGDQVRAFLHEHETRAAVAGMVTRGRITTEYADELLNLMFSMGRSA